MEPRKEIIGPCELTCEDCMDLMKRYPDKYFDLAIVDPPYGNNDAIGIKNGNSHLASRNDYKLFSNKAPTDVYFSELKRISKNQIIWGGNFLGYRAVISAGINMERFLAKVSLLIVH